MDSKELYQIAYDHHYNKKDYVKAYNGYLRVQKMFPDSTENKYAAMQIKNLSSVLDLSNAVIDDDIKEYVEKINSEKQRLEEKKQIALEMEAARKAEEQRVQQYRQSVFENALNVDNYILVNEESKKWALCTKANDNCLVIGQVYDYNDLVKYDVVENGSTINSSNIKNAVIGGFLFGAAGAIVGATTNSQSY